jgi:glycine/D-amino acid oxidase-like deaminating enzyme
VQRDPDARVPERVYDYLIVGAGIYGLPLAFFLADRHGGARQVLVVEDNTIPGECITVNTGGIIRACYSDPGIMRVAAFARNYFMNPTAAMRLDRPVTAGFVRTGWGRFVNEREAPGSLTAIQAIAASAADSGIPEIAVRTIDEYLSTLPAKRKTNLRKILELDDVTHVLTDGYGGYADGGTALLAFYEAALSRGVHVSLNSSVVDFLRAGDCIQGVAVERWVSGPGGTRERVRLEEIRARHVVLAAGQHNGRLVRLATGLEMPTFPSYHQTPYIRNTAELDLEQEPNEPPAAGERCAAPVISHWRDLYLRPEGSGLLVGGHHSLLHPDDYRPVGGVIDMGGSRLQVGVDQVLLDKLLASMEYFPVLMSNGLNLGKRPSDISGGVYYMNPEEAPFEGQVPGAHGTLSYIGSGCGNGFKVGPGVAYLLFQRLCGVPLADRLIETPALSAERATYFFPKGTSRSELLGLFRPVEEGGRLRHRGSAGIASGPGGGRR